MFETRRADRARFEAIWAQPAYELPRCGVPGKMISFVCSRIILDRRIACHNKQVKLLYSTDR